MKILAHVLALIVLAASGCSSLQPGSDPVVVNAERTIEMARVTLDAFTRFEFNNRARLDAAAPAVGQAAEKIRRHAPEWFASALRLKAAYKDNRSQDNQANLLTAIAVLQQASAEAAALTAAHQ
ncbi:MAG: hypothetical protein FD161_56 [Limisphaerales bacterium]|nr:MAG: hypothetical protein FD161_56 [Limisphaerales bacterium]KAG0510502.1 MAG: hypothetical protein E1N63_56 [Limisphaerales bacterium]TXT52775.1 MAG: hypothetical protein FD140_318 [Limisphaerales bacterium]